MCLFSQSEHPYLQNSSPLLSLRPSNLCPLVKPQSLVHRHLRVSDHHHGRSFQKAIRTSGTRRGLLVLTMIRVLAFTLTLRFSAGRFAVISETVLWVLRIGAKAGVSVSRDPSTGFQLKRIYKGNHRRGMRMILPLFSSAIRGSPS